LIKGNLSQKSPKEIPHLDASGPARPKVLRPLRTSPLPSLAKQEGRIKFKEEPRRLVRPQPDLRQASKRRPHQKGKTAFAGRPPATLRYLRWCVLILLATSGVILWQRTFQREELRRPAPLFQSRTVDRRPISLSDYVGQKKIVLVFYRGSFSSTSTDRLIELQKNYPRIREIGAELIAISTESENTAARTVTDFRLTYPFISDIQITKQYGTYNSGTLLSQPAVFIIDREGKIRWKHIGRGPLDFPPSSQILSELEKL